MTELELIIKLAILTSATLTATAAIAVLYLASKAETPTVREEHKKPETEKVEDLAHHKREEEARAPETPLPKIKCPLHKLETRIVPLENGLLAIDCNPKHVMTLIPSDQPPKMLEVKASIPEELKERMREAKEFYDEEVEEELEEEEE